MKQSYAAQFPAMAEVQDDHTPEPICIREKKMSFPHPLFLKSGGRRNLLSATAVCLILILLWTGLFRDA